QHQRSHQGFEEYTDGVWTDGASVSHPSTLTPDYTYFDLLAGFYLDFPYLTGAQGWPAPVDFYLDGFELYEETNPENTDQVASLHAAYVPSSNTIQVGWQRNKLDDVTPHEVRYSFTDVFVSGWDAATPAPNGVVTPRAGSGPYASMEWSG